MKLSLTRNERLLILFLCGCTVAGSLVWIARHAAPAPGPPAVSAPVRR